MEHEHSKQAIARRLAGAPSSSYLRDWVYGGIDGAVTTFAIVAGVIGAELSNRVVLISASPTWWPTASPWPRATTAAPRPSTRSRRTCAPSRSAISRRCRTASARDPPDLPRQGLQGRDLERAVDVITADHDRWVDTMLAEEYGLPKAVRSPLKAAASTFASFVLCGAVPLLPFLVGVPAAFYISVVMTALVFFLIGSTKSRWSPVSWWRSGSETMAIGLGAAVLAFVIGYALKFLV